MNDLEYVKDILSQDYQTEFSHEIPYPTLGRVIAGVSFAYLKGTVEGETPNGSQSRDGHDYLWFQHGKKSILSHRFIAAVTLEKWVPRDFDVDHINHNPSDNRPINLRIVTRRDNAGNRRKALLSELVDLEAVSKALEASASLNVPEPKPRPTVTTANSQFDEFLREPIPPTTFTGETKPCETGGTWHKTNHGSWHYRKD